MHEKEAQELLWVFKSVVEANYSIDEIGRQIRRKGSTLTLKNLWWVLKNPFYCGKIFVPAYKDEPAMFVKGLHKPIITESFFYELQEALQNRGRKRKTTVVSQEEIPLRGFLTCPKCSKNLTASASKGRKQYYYYYHCSSKCGVRFRAEDVNNAFVKELSKFKPKKEFVTSIKELFTGLFDKEKKLRASERFKLIDQIDQESAKLMYPSDQPHLVKNGFYLGRYCSQFEGSS
ncbi:recombinase family protein [Belliella pelovolcani]|uniref:recombinase family protein n=1 Tax=Belliella pelovolcani TaxID=529505 RepID=UPI0021CD20AF|nr:recombinase family protein [Belliella pelovolcani]